MKIVVISPTYNEKVNITKMIPVLEEEVFPQIKNHEMLLLIADDHSPDGTADVVKEYMKKWKNIHLLEGKKEGLGAAYVRAMRYASKTLKADAVIEFDADFQHNPHDIPKLVEAFDGGYEYVIGSRYIKGGKIPPEWGWDRKIQSIFGSLFARIVLFMFGVHDMTSGFKLTKMEFLDKIDLEHLYSKYYAYKIQMLYEIAQKGAKIKEVPIVFMERKEGSSKISRKDLIDSFYVVIKLRIRDSQRIIKFLVVGGVGFTLNAITLHLLVDYSHWIPAVANLIGAAIAIFSNFNFNNIWTFGERKVLHFPTYIKKLLHFYATSSFGVVVWQTGAIFLGDLFFGRQHYFIYFVIGTAILLVWNFTIYNKFIWKDEAAIV
jgi:dolichol-phosphate mannosyltransferase